MASATSSSVSYSTPHSDSQRPQLPWDALCLPWDVFLSFRGPDTRTKFVSHLYDKLIGYSIRTFQDDHELHTGDVISKALFEAIQGSKTYVVVFSENYAHSSWCLDELVEIYKCHQNMNSLVIGVYYNIDPSVVRHQTKSFQKDFIKHQTRFDDKAVNQWRTTLKNVADFSGKHVSGGRDESDIINEIVDVILREIKPRALPVAKYPVGLDSRLKYFTALLSSGAEGVTKIGLHGLGGVGKTTLAKALYNQLLLRRFNGSCFLAEVSRGTNGLVPLQQQLIDDVLRSKTKVKVHNVEEGTVFIRERICSTEVLVVLDDIDDVKQYEYLVGPFAPGSVVIITTRDEDVLIKINVEPKYRYLVNGLDDVESLALFNKHAFGNAIPDNTLMVLSEEILLLSGRLPLALEVFGSHLYMKSEVGMWEAYIKQLKRDLNSTILQKLMISLDALESDDRMLKKIFLDIACCFIGRKREEVVEIMETYYSDVNQYFDTLKKRSLLTINNQDELGMHDLLQKMGRQVAQNNSPDDFGKHSRLWGSKDICKVLGRKKGTEEIEVIIPSNFYYNQDALEGVTYTPETFKRMSRLRFLCLKNAELSGSFKEIFEKLRWFSWECCPSKCLPSDFCPEELVILALRGSNMRKMWERNMVSAVFQKLTTLDMSNSLHLIMTPDFSKFPNLENLNLKGCKSLKEVHISIGCLARLVYLNLGDCVNLRTLPDSICNLKTLNTLNIDGCITLIGSLTEVNAWGLVVWKLPISIRHLSKLVELNPSTHWDVYLCLRGIYTTETFSNILYKAVEKFRGVHKREAFSDRLYEALSRNYISIYMDNPEVRSKGKVISHILPKAIEESKTSVVLLSEDYALSERCLDELTEILNCHKTMQKLVIPVYYRIDPYDVRHQAGSFKEAFEKHQILYAGEMEKVNNWRRSLREVTEFPGYHISPSSDESNIINEILDVIQHEINPRPLNVGEFPVGLDSRVKYITTLLNSHTEGVIKFGIYGMGGVGKSTLAKALYNHLLGGRSFKGSCFLADVREVSGTLIGLESLQEQLVNDVLRNKKTFTVHNVEEGSLIIRQRICSANVLVVIDDIDDLRQYESLIGPFASGSVVIITTRDEEILDKIEVETRYRYMVNTLDEADALALFKRHAFGSAEPNDTLMELSKDILCLAGGLPLALEVYGSHLYLQPEVGWKYFIEKLQRIPNRSIYQKFMVRLDALESEDPMLKQMFLDIACFFIGRKKEDVVRIMETYYSYPDHMIDILKKRCLLTINKRDELVMHDLFQDMGKEVAHNNSVNEPGKHSRLWVLKDIFHVLKKHKGTEAIEGIIPHYPGHPDSLQEVSFDAETFRRMSNLRFLYLKNVNLTGSFEHIFENLRFLCWEGCPLKCLPFEFHPQKLGILELPHSKLTTLWEKNMASEVFDKLKTLDMSHSLDLTTTPDFSKLPRLETLILEGCKSLEEIHISSGSLMRLFSLNLKYCCNVTSLSNLKQLEFLDVTDCSSLTEIQGLEKLTSLRNLHVGGCKSSLLAYILTRRFFQIYSGFGHEINIYIREEEFPDWIRQLPDWIGQSSNLGSTVSFNLPPNVSHNFLAVILCFKHWEAVPYGETTYSVKNTTSGFIWSGSFDSCYPEAQIIIVPRSIFPIEDGDERIELTADAEILGIHLLNSREIAMIDQSESLKWLKLLWVRPFWHKLLLCLRIYFWKKFKSICYMFWPSWILYWVRRRLAQYKDNRKKRGEE